MSLKIWRKIRFKQWHYLKCNELVLESWKSRRPLYYTQMLIKNNREPKRYRSGSYWWDKKCLQEEKSFYPGEWKTHETQIKSGISLVELNCSLCSHGSWWSYKSWRVLWTAPVFNKWCKSKRHVASARWLQCKSWSITITIKLTWKSQPRYSQQQ